MKSTCGGNLIRRSNLTIGSVSSIRYITATTWWTKCGQRLACYFHLLRARHMSNEHVEFLLHLLLCDSLLGDVDVTLHAYTVMPWTLFKLKIERRAWTSSHLQVILDGADVWMMPVHTVPKCSVGSPISIRHTALYLTKFSTTITIAFCTDSLDVVCAQGPLSQLADGHLAIGAWRPHYPYIHVRR